MKLLIDDTRDISYDVIARTFNAGLKMLLIGGWECICFDHDLGMGKTGYDLLKLAINNNLVNDAIIQLVSSNPVGRNRMKNLLLDNNYNTKDNFNFIKHENEKETKNETQE